MTQEEMRIKCAELEGWTYIEKLAYTGIPKGSRGNADARVIPDYLNDANDALRLCGVLGKRGWKVEIDRAAKTGLWHCFLYKDGDSKAWVKESQYESFCLAICTAALRAEGGGI